MSADVSGDLSMGGARLSVQYMRRNIRAQNTNTRSIHQMRKIATSANRTCASHCPAVAGLPKLNMQRA